MHRFTFFFLIFFLFFQATAGAQDAKQSRVHGANPDRDRDYIRKRTEWFYRGRVMHGSVSAELRRRAFQTKLQMRAQRVAARTAVPHAQLPLSSGAWMPLGPAPLASDASGNGMQDYGPVAGRATAVAIDPADASGNTIYIGGAQGGVWKSTNAADPTANNVSWVPLTDNQATLSIGAIAIQPGNSDATKSVILAATGEANSSADSYFGLGILRSTDAGNTWSLISKANNGALSFGGLGGTRMAFSSANPSTVVAAMATTSEGLVAGAVTPATVRGLYTSLDAGLTWNSDAISDTGGATDATSATSVIYNAGARLFFAAIRYHGFYSSPDGVNWTRLATQPGGAALSAVACPPQSTANNRACPIYRGEITVVPERNEMYVWYVSLALDNSVVDGGIWQSFNGGASWNAISDSGIANCGDVDGCGVEQGAYNLELLALPTGAATDLYAGAVNLYKCGINTANPTCMAVPFMNLTHAYGCVPAGAPAHVHPDQHAVTAMIPATGSDSGNALLYFANDGGIYRALNGYIGLNSGLCSGINQFDDLNQNLGSLTQFVSFSQHPSDANTLLGGTQDNGSPATNQAMTNSSWINVLGGDGGYNAIDALAPSNWYASNPDVPPGGLGIQLCSDGVNCNNGAFHYVVTSNTLGGDDGAFYFPYVLDPYSASALLVGTCRVWRGSKIGGAFVALSPNFETLGSGPCSGNEVNQVTAIAVGGLTDAIGSTVIYAATSGLGPLNGPFANPAGGRVWVTTDASSGFAAFTEVTGNGPQGSINPNQFPISGVAVDSRDPSGNTAYVTVMGFTGGAGHVWKTTNAGLTWTDFTANLPDSPVNAVVVYPPMSQVFVATDVGVFGSPTSGANWTELGPNPSANQAGFLPNVAVTALGVFASGGQQLLRASTYGRGMWQFNLSSAPDFQLSLSNPQQTISGGQSAAFQGSAIALNGYSNSVMLSCTAGATAPPSNCGVVPTSLTPSIKAPFTVNASGSAGDYYFGVQGVGSDSTHTTHKVSAALHIVNNNGPDFSLSLPGAFPTVNAGTNDMGGPINVTATNGFTGTITLTCSLVSANGNCSVSPATVTSIPTMASVMVDARSLTTGSYQLLVQGSSGSTIHRLLISFNVGDYEISGQPVTIGLGGQGIANLMITSTYYSGKINAACDASALSGATCVESPANPIPVSAGAKVPLTSTITVPSSVPLQTYTVIITAQDTSGSPSHSFPLQVTVVPDFSIRSSTPPQVVTPGQTAGPYNLIVQPVGTLFPDPVTLACPGFPSGTQCQFSPSAVVTPGAGAQTVAMSITTSTNTPAGSYALTVTASSGTLSHSVVLSLTIANDFQLTVAQPFPAYVDVGMVQNAAVLVTTNYNGTISAKCSIPSAISAQCTVTPSVPSAVSANAPVVIAVTLNVPAPTASGAYISLVVTDSSGLPNHTLHLPINVEDFGIVSSTTTQTVSAGQTTASYNLTIQPAGASFDSAVTLTCSGLPAGAQCLFTPPTPVIPGSTAQPVAMSISTAETTGIGVYAVKVTASSGPVSHSATVSLNVASSVTPPDFQFAVTQPFPSVIAGSRPTAQITVTPNYNGAITASCDASAVSASCIVTPNSASIVANTPQSLTLSISNLPNDISPATYQIGVTVSDSSGQPSHSWELPFSVIQDFSVISATPTQTVKAGQTTGAYQLTIAPNPPGSTFTGAVSVSCTGGLPVGAQCLFNPPDAQIPGRAGVQVVMTISTQASKAGWLTFFPGSSGFWVRSWMLMAILLGWPLAPRRNKNRRMSGLAIACMFLLTLLLPSCSGVSNSGGGGGNQSVPMTYHVTVTGTSPGTAPDEGQSTVVTLVVD